MAAPLRSAGAAASTAAKSGIFTPRAVFEVTSSLPRSYYLGHHVSALASMRKILSSISLILECRDSRIPITSANPLLETALAGRDRIIVYTKSNLLAPGGNRQRVLKEQRQLLGDFHAGRLTGSGVFASEEQEDELDNEDGWEIQPGARRPKSSRREEQDRDAEGGPARTTVVFTDQSNLRSINQLIETIKQRAVAAESLTGLRAMVVGMPNSGKSSLLNVLRRVGMSPELPNAARTGAEPGVTRKLSTPVRVIPEDTAAGIDSGVFVVDAPGVFVPYVSDVEAMLKLSLVGCVKDGLVPAETIADYLLFQMNLRDPTMYGELSAPTNDPLVFLENIALRTGKLEKGGLPNIVQAADWIVQQWRGGFVGRFGLDEVSETALRARALKDARGESDGPVSMNQARKRIKEARKEKQAAKRGAAKGGGIV
ncbi:P-loop containing nucleoside triphosphate hydrolase protein [Hypoxylon fragiforme]|uniref:P-loop containing nucleoside triphosphate hydrolase protein n=1 Tax=Hypoxylon fragiforme TaxID=63214 RepID=UPI0020C6A901|nr:P-loop containing nucleoside triphosphate hydrolase protein [Hypoxylon fragiforme]KAI2605320.1 P-loop containing nucleoside triphosphate hydrolase protein [Hypoxylon fragiforme]